MPFASTSIEDISIAVGASSTSSFATAIDAITSSAPILISTPLEIGRSFAVITSVSKASLEISTIIFCGRSRGAASTSMSRLTLTRIPAKSLTAGETPSKIRGIATLTFLPFSIT